MEKISMLQPDFEKVNEFSVKNSKFVVKELLDAISQTFTEKISGRLLESGSCNLQFKNYVLP